MTSLPPGLVAYHQAGGRLEGDLGDEKPGWYQLWPLETIDERNRAYLVEEQAPGYLGIGSDGGGEMIALSPTGEIVILPFIGMEPSEAWFVAESWNEFESESSQAAPNTRVQRTRAARFARTRSPLTRHPLGDRYRVP